MRTVEQTRGDHARTEPARDDFRRFSDDVSSGRIARKVALFGREQAVGQKQGQAELSAVRVPRQNKVELMIGVFLDLFGSMGEQNRILIWGVWNFVEQFADNFALAP